MWQLKCGRFLCHAFYVGCVEKRLLHSLPREISTRSDNKIEAGELEIRYERLEEAERYSIRAQNIDTNKQAK